MRTFLKRKERGVAGLEVLLSVIVTLFVIGFLVMIFAVMGGELESEIQNSVTNNATAVKVINDTYTEIAGVTDWFNIIIVITAMVILILLTVIIINAIRGSGIVAIGGGIVGDTAGFFASVYMRGVDFIFIPTTLMAQADTIINKVAISYKLLKNIIGSFYSPVLTVCDVDFLQTLPKKEISLGLSEVVKHSIIDSSSFFQYLKINLRPKLFHWKKYPWKEIVYKSLLIKSKLVVKDPFDKKGYHKGLSYGHTFANIFEGLSKFKFRHGEAVALGMHVSALISFKLGILSAKEFEQQKERGEHENRMERQRARRDLDKKGVSRSRKGCGAQKSSF